MNGRRQQETTPAEVEAKGLATLDRAWGRTEDAAAIRNRLEKLLAPLGHL